jgi:hypothetical protein
MKRIFSAALLLQLLFFAQAFGQFQNVEARYISQLRSKTLLVPTVEPDTRTLLNLKSNPEESVRYQAGLENVNSALKSAVDKYAKFAKAVEYMPQTKVNGVLKAGDTKYLVLQYGLREGYMKPAMFAEMYGDNEYTSDVRKIAKGEGYAMFQLMMPVKLKDPEVVYTVLLPVAYPSPADMIYGIQMINNQVATMQKQRTYQVNEFEQEITKNNKLLKNRTLLIDPAQLDGKTTADDLSKSYANELRVVDYSEINKAIVENDSTVAYVIVVPMEVANDKLGYGKAKMPLMHLVLSAENAQVLAKSRVTRMDYDKLAEDVSKKEVKDYVVKP